MVPTALNTIKGEQVPGSAESNSSSGSIKEEAAAGGQSCILVERLEQAAKDDLRADDVDVDEFLSCNKITPSTEAPEDQDDLRNLLKEVEEEEDRDVGAQHLCCHDQQETRTTAELLPVPKQILAINAENNNKETDKHEDEATDDRNDLGADTKSIKQDEPRLIQPPPPLMLRGTSNLLIESSTDDAPSVMKIGGAATPSRIIISASGSSTSGGGEHIVSTTDHGAAAAAPGATTGPGPGAQTAATSTNVLVVPANVCDETEDAVLGAGGNPSSPTGAAALNSSFVSFVTTTASKSVKEQHIQENFGCNTTRRSTGRTSRATSLQSGTHHQSSKEKKKSKPQKVYVGPSSVMHMTCVKNYLQKTNASETAKTLCSRGAGGNSSCSSSISMTINNTSMYSTANSGSGTTRTRRKTSMSSSASRGRCTTTTAVNGTSSGLVQEKLNSDKDSHGAAARDLLVAGGQQQQNAKNSSNMREGATFSTSSEQHDEILNRVLVPPRRGELNENNLKGFMCSPSGVGEIENTSTMASTAKGSPEREQVDNNSKSCSSSSSTFAAIRNPGTGATTSNLHAEAPPRPGIGKIMLKKEDQHEDRATSTFEEEEEQNRKNSMQSQNLRNLFALACYVRSRFDRFFTQDYYGAKTAIFGIPVAEATTRHRLWDLLLTELAVAAETVVEKAAPGNHVLPHDFEENRDRDEGSKEFESALRITTRKNSTSGATSRTSRPTRSTTMWTTTTTSDHEDENYKQIQDSASIFCASLKSVRLARKQAVEVLSVDEDEKRLSSTHPDLVNTMEADHELNFVDEEDACLIVNDPAEMSKKQVEHQEQVETKLYPTMNDVRTSFSPEHTTTSSPVPIVLASSAAKEIVNHSTRTDHGSTLLCEERSREGDGHLRGQPLETVHSKSTTTSSSSSSVSCSTSKALQPAGGATSTFASVVAGRVDERWHEEQLAVFRNVLCSEPFAIQILKAVVQEEDRKIMVDDEVGRDVVPARGGHCAAAPGGGVPGAGAMASSSSNSLCPASARSNKMNISRDTATTLLHNIKADPVVRNHANASPAFCGGSSSRLNLVRDVRLRTDIWRHCSRFRKTTDVFAEGKNSRIMDETTTRHQSSSSSSPMTEVDKKRDREQAEVADFARTTTGEGQVLEMNAVASTIIAQGIIQEINGQNDSTVVKTTQQDHQEDTRENFEARRFSYEALSLWSMKWRPVEVLEVMRNTKSEDQLVRVHYIGYDPQYDELIPDNPGRLPVRLRSRRDFAAAKPNSCTGHVQQQQGSTFDQHPQLLAAQVEHPGAVDQLHQSFDNCHQISQPAVPVVITGAGAQPPADSVNDLTAEIRRRRNLPVWRFVLPQPDKEGDSIVSHTKMKATSTSTETNNAIHGAGQQGNGLPPPHEIFTRTPREQQTGEEDEQQLLHQQEPDKSYNLAPSVVPSTQNYLAETGQHNRAPKKKRRRSKVLVRDDGVISPLDEKTIRIRSSRRASAEVPEEVEGAFASSLGFNNINPFLFQEEDPAQDDELFHEEYLAGPSSRGMTRSSTSKHGGGGPHQHHRHHKGSKQRSTRDRRWSRQLDELVKMFY
ncbi:unnamed protein product [Amoebophrya sp. A120]|nr:unnamed protein product [Amoebophrya sp. A120]|eukprot:GSA120T00018347001.1